MTNSLAKYRLAAGLTQVELAERSGLSVTWISHLETGRKTATAESATKIADALGVPPSELGICQDISAPEGFTDVAVLGTLAIVGLEWGVQLSSGLGYVRMVAAESNLVAYVVGIDLGRLKNGDLVFAVPGATPQAGDVVIATHAGAGTQVRKFEVLGSGVQVLRSMNGGPDAIVDGWTIDAVATRILVSASLAL